MRPLFILLMGLFSTRSLSAQIHTKWIKQSVFYQIYPSSFQDNDGNGIGDLKGIESRLDYVQSLEVNAIWLNPVFKSAFMDGGYDVIDFYQVDPRFGTNTTLVELATQVHQKGMHIVLDLVVGVEHVCIGTDTKMATPKNANDRFGKNTNQSWKSKDGFFYTVVDAMLKSGFTKNEIIKIGGGNYCRIFDKTTIV